MAGDWKPTYVNTTQVARALGVSVSTVKRWVDDEILPARKTAGGHRKLLVADIIELVRRGEFPNADLSHLISPDLRGPAPSAGSLADALYQALVAGDATQTRAIIRGEFRRGAPIEELADRLIHPAMDHIGNDWATGRIDVMEEHRASQICAAALYELKAILEESALKDRRRAVGGAPPGDHSVLPSLLAQMVLLDAGWDAVNLGPDTPFPSFARALTDLRPRLVWLSISHVLGEDDFVRKFGEFYGAAERAGVAVAIGGRALADSLRSRLRYTTYGDGLAHLAAFARTLHPRPAPPRRGRHGSA